MTNLERPAILSGPYGTILKGMGKRFENPVNILDGGDYRRVIVDIAREYARHADVATTNSFGLRGLLRRGESELFDEALSAHYDAVIEAITGLRRKVFVSCGPYGECYSPEESPSAAEAKDFHSDQLSHVLRLPHVDKVLFETVCSAGEGVGIAQAARDLGVPAIISFVVHETGVLLSGERLHDAIAEADAASGSFPYGYGVNCCSVEGLKNAFSSSNGQRGRLVIAYPNASSKDPRELEECDGIVSELDPDTTADDLFGVARENPGLAVVGGCCGFDHAAIASLRRGVLTRVGEQARSRI